MKVLLLLVVFAERAVGAAGEARVASRGGGEDVGGRIEGADVAAAGHKKRACKLHVEDLGGAVEGTLFLFSSVKSR